MKYHSISIGDLRPSVLCLGGALFGSSVDRTLAFDFLDLFFERGGNFLDTARVYGAWLPDGLGISETIIGEWLQARGVREKVVLATKGGHPDLSSMHISRLSRQQILADLEASLRSLRTEYIDLYWLHRDDPQRPVAELLEPLNTLVKEGKIRAFGCSNWQHERVAEAIDYAQTQGIAGFVGNQLMWSLARPNTEALQDPTMAVMDAQTFALHQRTGLFVAAYSSQARGFFQKVSHNPASLSADQQALYQNEENTKRLHRLQKAAQDLSLSPFALALAYLINQPILTFPIIGGSRLEHVLESIPAGDVDVSAEVIQYLDQGEK
jgi:aryl-alcohol dehydrogenase-like predicted oxidoreductase